MIKEYLISKGFDTVIATVKYVLKNTNLNLKSQKEDFEESLNYHLREIKNWSQEISFSDLKKAKNMSDVYIDLDLFIYPRKIKYPDETIETKLFSDHFNNLSTHVILLGQPGAGKTTSIKHICQNVLFDDQFIRSVKFPIVIRLRDLNKRSSSKKAINSAGPIIESLFQIFGIELSIDSTELKTNYDIKVIKEKIIVDILNRLSPILLFDGFDEVVYKNTRKDIISDIRLLSNQLENSFFILTSRSNDFEYNIDNTVQYEIAPLQEKQIFTFIQKWLQDKSKAKQLFNEIKNSPFADTAIRPLTLAHLCAIFERIGKIPEKPKTVYRKIVNLLLEEWDEQRSVRRSSEYANFEVDRKFEFLSNLAYMLTTSINSSIFSKRVLSNVYRKIHIDFGLELKELKTVVIELETHTGLLIESSYEYFEFAHKSIQEYLTAEYMVKLPALPSNLTVLSRLPNELAIAITISSNPSLYFSELLFTRLLKLKFRHDFIKIFVNRLILEKPDFNKQHDVIISALTLYSLYMGIQINDPAQLSLFVFDNLTVEFERFIKNLMRVNSKKIVDEYYDTIDKISTSDNQDLYLIELKEKYRRSKYPLRLYYRENFFS